MGLPFLGMDVREGRVYALLAENDDDDTHISMDDICHALHVDMKDLHGKIRIASRAGLDSVLMSFVEGRPQTTALFEQLVRQVKEFSPVLVILETAADLFAGNENDRGQVRQFLASCCARIALEAGAAVLICAHPSVEGMRSGGGSGGSTAWNNTLRSRLWLRRDVDKEDQEADADVRLLELKKANFAQRGTALRLRWQEGVFVPDGRKSFPLASAAQQAREAQQIVATRYESDLPFSAYAQAGRRWLGHWVMETFRKSRRAATKLVDNWVSQGLIVEVRDRHLHRTVLCTPEQAKNARAKETR
jgi:RecA-family ATPase